MPRHATPTLTPAQEAQDRVDGWLSRYNTRESLIDAVTLMLVGWEGIDEHIVAALKEILEGVEEG